MENIQEKSGNLPKISNEITVGFGGAAGDGLDKSGNLLARVINRLGLYAISYNSFQSLIRGGHTFLKLRISERKELCYGDHLNAFLAMNQDSIERHAPAVESGGVIIFNSDRVTCDISFLQENVHVIPLSFKELTSDMGKLIPIMQNTMMLGSLFYLVNLDFKTLEEVLRDIFKHKGQEIIDQNIHVARIGYETTLENFDSSKINIDWNFTHISKPFYSGNTAMALGAVAAGLKFYAAYPMSPASNILHWLVANSERCGVVVKQAEDEIAVVNLAIGAGYAGVRSMCATSGGGFALMTEAIGEAGMIEAPVVIVNVQRGGPSTGLPTKTEQGDLNQAIGASQGDFPKVIMAPKSTIDCYHIVGEALNIAEQYQLPVIILSDLLIGENYETIQTGSWSHDVKIKRGELLEEVPQSMKDKDGFKRYAFTSSGISPRPLIGSEGMVYVAATDDHDEDGVIISDVFTNTAIRRKINEKRMRKLDGVLNEFDPPQLEGSEDAEVTLIGWGSTWGVIHETIEQLESEGINANQLHFRYLLPFHSKEALQILNKCKKTIVVEVNATGQFARHLKAETGFSCTDIILKYDGEPFEPKIITQRVVGILNGEPLDLNVTQDEAREMAYHYIRVHIKDKLRPSKIIQVSQNGYGEPVWVLDLTEKNNGELKGKLTIGVETGSTHKWDPAN